MSGKRKVSVCTGHELANALYNAVLPPNAPKDFTEQRPRTNSPVYQYTGFLVIYVGFEDTWDFVKLK